MNRPQPLVGIVLGSASDRQVMAPAWQTLSEFGVPHELSVCSAHRTPARAADYASRARERGLRVLIAGAGAAAHLAAVLAAHTTLPVIGVPLNSSPLQGLDALYATVQMPSGVPVATVAIDGARNAALLAVQILAVSDEELAGRLAQMKAEMTAAVERADVELKTSL